MPKRAWKQLAPQSLRHAMRLSLDFARDERNRSVARVADHMGLPSEWTLYKWMESARLPAVLIRAFESACDCPHLYVTRYLAHSAHLLVIPMPSGRALRDADIHTTQAVLTGAVGALLAHAERHRTAEDTIAALTVAMETLAYQREQIAREDQPELEFGDD